MKWFWLLCGPVIWPQACGWSRVTNPSSLHGGFPSVGIESLMPQGISKSQENWDSLPGIVLTLNLQGRCPGNYFTSEQTRTLGGTHLARFHLGSSRKKER